MTIPSSLESIDAEYLNILRKEMKWVYSKLNNKEMNKFEKKLVEINRMFVVLLSTTIVKDRIINEEKSFDEMLELFKISMN